MEESDEYDEEEERRKNIETAEQLDFDKLRKIVKRLQHERATCESGSTEAYPDLRKDDLAMSNSMTPAEIAAIQERAEISKACDFKLMDDWTANQVLPLAEHYQRDCEALLSALLAEKAENERLKKMRDVDKRAISEWYALWQDMHLENERLRLELDAIANYRESDAVGAERAFRIVRDKARAALESKEARK